MYPKINNTRPYAYCDIALKMKPEIYAAQLKRGLKRLGPQFIAEICDLCGGHGEYRQTYNAGCGMGYYHSTGACDCCDALGLRQGWGGAHLSVVHQVLNAGA